MAYIKRIRNLVGHEPLIMTSASGALLNDDGAVLLQSRADTGDWGFPGGYMEYGESFVETLQREFKEDGGFEVIPVKLLQVMDQDFYTYPNGDQVQPINAFFLVKLANSKHFPTKATETNETKFWSLDQQPPHFFNGQHEKMWRILQNELHH